MKKVKVIGRFSIGDGKRYEIGAEYDIEDKIALELANKELVEIIGESSTISSIVNNFVGGDQLSGKIDALADEQKAVFTNLLGDLVEIVIDVFESCSLEEIARKVLVLTDISIEEQVEGSEIEFETRKNELTNSIINNKQDSWTKDQLESLYGLFVKPKDEAEAVIWENNFKMLVDAKLVLKKHKTEIESLNEEIHSY